MFKYWIYYFYILLYGFIFSFKKQYSLYLSLIWDHYLYLIFSFNIICSWTQFNGSHMILYILIFILKNVFFWKTEYQREGRERKRGEFTDPIHWFTPRMAGLAPAGQAETRSQPLNPDLPSEWWELKHLSHHPMPSQTYFSTSCMKTTTTYALLISSSH